ncbi:Telomerase-binding protein est1a [Dirofilaria immitis]|nr:Telomerase-binding protein est1a [Dirofilaria immitis]
MSKPSPKIMQNDNARKARPTIQLYCPRVRRIAAVSKRWMRKKKCDYRGVSKPDEYSKSFKYIYSSLLCTISVGVDFELGIILDYANLNSHVGNRQPGNNGLLNADTCKVKMIFNEPLRKSSNSINKSCDHLIDGFSSPKTRLGRRMYSSSINCYSSSQSLCEDCSTDNNIYHYNGSVSSRFRTKISSLNRNEAFGLNSTSPSVKEQWQLSEGHYPSSITYRCHQQQHHSQQGNSYCSGNVRHNSNKYHTVPMRCTSGDGKNYSTCGSYDEEPIYANDNDLSQTNFERHQRNWSFKINESQDFSQLFRHRNNKNSRMNRANNISQDSSQDAKGKESLTKKSGEVSKHISFQDLCASLDSIDLASFDWSSEVEAEEQRKKEQEEQIRMTEEQSSQTNSSSSQKKDLDEPSHHFNNISRQQNDGSTSQASSIAECIEEQSEIEGGSGERTPTNDKRETTSNFSSQKLKRKGKIGVHENRGRNKRTSRWKMKKQHNPRESEVSTSDCNTTISQYIRSDSRRDNDLSAATSNALKATSPILKNITGSTTVALVARRSPREEHSDIPSPSNGSSTLLTKVSSCEFYIICLEKELLPPNEWPIHSEISCKEGPQIQALNDTINHLIDRITESADPSASEEILTASYTYMMNLEQHLWKQCFYTSIEALRAASNATGNSSSIFRTSLSRLIQQGLAFYALLLNKYEIAFGFVIDDYLYWSSNLPVDDFVGCILIGSGAHEATDHIVKVALLSVQRLTVSIGDLHRYNSMTTGIKDYSHARVWYQKAAQLAAGNGRSYNQLALLAVYESKWIDVIFYYVRALAARYPFETARQPLFTAFNHVSEFEIEFNARVGDSVTREAEAAAARADRPQEIWIAQDGKLSSGDFANITDHRTIHALKSISTVELFRRAVPYLLHTSGLLITKIGMEEYDSISERALFQLSQLISRDECPLSSLHLVQLCILFLYAVHSLTLKMFSLGMKTVTVREGAFSYGYTSLFDEEKHYCHYQAELLWKHGIGLNSQSLFAEPIDSEPDTCSLQQQQAVQMVLSLFGVILKPVYDELPDLSGILDGSIRLPSKMRRVLPAVFVISEWLSMPSVNRLYRSMPSLESIETSLIQVDTWKLLADVANTLVNAESRGILSRTVAQSNTKSEEHVEVVLPESVFLASFIDVFTVLPKSLKMSSLTNIDLRNNVRSPLLALHARLSSLLSTAEYLDGSELPCFGFDEHLRCFAATRCASPVTVLKSFSDECKHHRQTIRENQKLLERETKGNRMIIEVRPKYLVPDTNTFIDHLTSIKKIVESHRFTVLVPTTVFSELESLSRLSSSSKHIVGGQEDFQDHWVGERAKEAVAYLKDLIGKQVPQVYTITSKGNLLTSLMFATEEICTSGELKLCELRKTRSKPPNAVATEQSASTCMVDVGQPTRLYRSVVLLTEDRALNIKAVCENIPCRTVPSFMKWAAVK